MKQEKKVDIDVLYEELRAYCFDVLVYNPGFWRGDAGGDEKAVRAKFAYINGVFKLWFDGRYYGSEVTEEDRIVSYLEILTQ